MGAGMAGGFSIWRGTRWLRRGLRRGARVVSLGMFVVGTIAATVETIKNSRDRKEDHSGESEISDELRDLKTETELLEQEVNALRREKSELNKDA